MCNASNSAGFAEAEANLRVREVDDGSVKFNVTFKIGSTLILPCIVEAGPPATTSWTRETENATETEELLSLEENDEGQRVRMDKDGFLRMDDLKDTDAGAYTCRAVTAGRTRYTTAYLEAEQDEEEQKEEEKEKEGKNVGRAQLEV